MKNKLGEDTENFGEVFNAIQDQENLHRNEGAQGVKNLGQLVHFMGYENSLYRHDKRESLLTFLEDNPGAIEAIKNWIVEQGDSTWKESLESHILEPEETEEDELPELEDAVEERRLELLERGVHQQQGD